MTTIERTLLFTDVVDSTQLVERVGDERAAQIWTEHDRRVRALLAVGSGREIDRTDGFFVLFETASDAGAFALSYHASIADLALSARVGIHVGLVTLRANEPEAVTRGAKPAEVEGLAKPFAARIMSLAAAGQTLLSQTACGALMRAAIDGAATESHGHYRLKGIEQPIEIFELGVTGRCAFAPPRDTDKAYRVIRKGGLWAPLREVRHNLPAERDIFVGREVELHALARRLDAGARLLTVVGPGGTGKTRLVSRYGMTWLGDWPGGVYFCDLSEARSHEGIFVAVARALGVPLGKADPCTQLGHAILGRKRCLVVLDNFEQVVEHARATLGHWLDQDSGASFVVTSRERLHLPGEELFPVEPLPLQREAIELFEVRAQAQLGAFAITDENRRAVAEVVRLLDGLPLAIELAAARIRVLSPLQLVDRIRDRFALLSGARNAKARQTTMRAAIDWSWNLLAPWEQTALAQCSVFEGGFMLAAAETVIELAGWPDAPSTLDVIQSLVDKSLLRSWSTLDASRVDIGEPYFGMYYSIHEYAAEKLRVEAPHSERTAQERHGRFYAQFGSGDELEALYRTGGVRRRKLLALELSNLIAATSRAIEREDAEAAVCCYRAAWEVLGLQGPFTLAIALGIQVLTLVDRLSRPGVAVQLVKAAAALRSGKAEGLGEELEEMLATSRRLGDKSQEAAVLLGLGMLHVGQGSTSRAQDFYLQSLAVCLDAGDRRAEGNVRAKLGVLHLETGHAHEALDFFHRALTIYRDLGDRMNEGVVLGYLGNLLNEQGQYGEANSNYLQALAIHREVGNRTFEGGILCNVGNVHYFQGHVDEAARHFAAALAIHREVGDRRVEGVLLANLGNLETERGEVDKALEHFEAALAIDREVHHRRAEGAALAGLANLRRLQGKLELGLENYAQGLVIIREVGDPRYEGTLLNGAGEILLALGRFDEAREDLALGEALLRNVADRLELAKLICVRGRLDAAEGDLERARDALAEAQRAADELHVGIGSELLEAIAQLQAVIGEPGASGSLR